MNHFRHTPECLVRQMSAERKERALKKLNDSGSPEKAFKIAQDDEDVKEVLKVQSFRCDCAHRAKERIESLIGTPGRSRGSRLSESNPCRRTCSTTHNPMFHSVRSSQANAKRSSSAESPVKRPSHIDWAKSNMIKQVQ